MLLENPTAKLVHVGKPIPSGMPPAPPPAGLCRLPLLARLGLALLGRRADAAAWAVCHLRPRLAGSAGWPTAGTDGGSSASADAADADGSASAAADVRRGDRSV